MPDSQRVTLSSYSACDSTPSRYMLSLHNMAPKHMGCLTKHLVLNQSNTSIYSIEGGKPSCVGLAEKWSVERRVTGKYLCSTSGIFWCNFDPSEFSLSRTTLESDAPAFPPPPQARCICTTASCFFSASSWSVE